MLQNNHSLARPCPSCGAPLRVHSGRLNQKMQCPKCLDTITLDPGATPPAAKTTTKRASRKKPAAEAPSAVDVSAHYAELLQEHAELAERYADVVTDYHALVETHADLAMRLHELSPPN